MRLRTALNATIHAAVSRAEPTRGFGAGIIPCTDPQLIDWAATDPEFDYLPVPGNSCRSEV